MAEINIEKSNLQNSPIIISALDTRSKKSKKNMFDPVIQGIFITVAGGLILAFLIFVISKIFQKNKMSEDTRQPKISIESSQLANSPIIVDSPGAVVNLSIPKKLSERQIQSIVIKAKMIGERMPGLISLPPSMDNPLLLNLDSNALLENHNEKEILMLQGPIFFDTKGNDVEVTNNFVLPTSSNLQNQPVETIRKFEILYVPINLGVEKGNITKIKKLTVVMTVGENEILRFEREYNDLIPPNKEPLFLITLKPNSSYSE